MLQRQRLLGGAVAQLAIILVGKSLAAFAIVLVLGFPISTGVLVSASLAQIGEFSFILAGPGIALGLLPPEGRDLILAGALLSITLNPVAFSLVRPVFPVFGDLDADQRAELLALFKPRSAAPGDRVIRAGDTGAEMFFISSGAVEVAIGRRRIQLGPGDVFGEMALLTGAPRSADVTAIDYCRFLILEKDDFERFVSRHPGLRQPLDEIAAERAAMNLREAGAPAAVQPS